MGKIADTLKGLIPSGGQLLNFGSSIASLLGRNSNLDKQLKAQKEENQKNRDFNLMLAQMQNEWNQNQWERENEYNSPVNQMKRFEEAGLNPDLIYGQGTSGNAMQLSGGLTAGAPSSPTDFTALGQKMTLGDAIRSSLDTEMQQAQIDAIRANTKKTLSETEGQNYSNEILKSDAKFRDAINLGTIATNEMNINLGNVTIDEKNENITKIRKECSRLDEDIQYLKRQQRYADALIKKTNSETALNRLEQKWYDKKTRAYIDNLSSLTGFTNAQCHRIYALLDSEIAGYELSSRKTEKDIELLDKLGIKYDKEAQRFDFDMQMQENQFNLDKKFRVWDTIINGLSAAASVVSSIYGFGKIGDAITGLGKKPSPPSTGSVGYPYN